MLNKTARVFLEMRRSGALLPAMERLDSIESLRDILSRIEEGANGARDLQDCAALLVRFPATMSDIVAAVEALLPDVTPHIQLSIRRSAKPPTRPGVIYAHPSHAPTR